LRRPQVRGTEGFRKKKNPQKKPVKSVDRKHFEIIKKGGAK